MKRLKALCFLFIFSILGTLFGDPSPKQCDVLGLSAIIIDHYFLVSEEELRLMTDEKGGWAPIEYPTLSSLLKQSEGASQMVPGGSGANVIKGLRALGETCAILGKVGSDPKGEYYVKKMEELGIVPLIEKGSLPTGQAICFITPDGERTFRSYLGASHSLSDLSFDPKIFDQVRLFHIEGYQLIDTDLVIRTLKLAKQAEILVSIDLGNVELVRRNKEFLEKILNKYVDIVFCNEKEAKILTGLKAPQACDKLAELCKVAVVTMSERGSWSRSGKEKVYMEALSTEAIDTTGAGDLYASGFLHGYLNGVPIKRCAWMGSFVASHVIRRIGAEIPESIWTEIREAIAKEN